MNQNEIDGLAPDMEMSTKEAAAYLSGPVGYALSTKAMYGLKSLGRGPVTEKRGRNLVYRKSALDAFLVENGTNPLAWTAGVWRDVADQYEAATAGHPDLQSEELLETLRSRDKDDWDPDAAR
ncbi:hypothetical protein [Arthrobacter sp. HS15c]|uniref:hypothetical protein n=1 Tax=Arthrobacter sp. HS15c TaxID=3230279 RepID=UPI00346584F4